MPYFNCQLTQEQYSWKNAILWGNFIAHCKGARQSSSKRFAHILMATLEFFPIVSQIVSIVEKIILSPGANKPTQGKSSNLSHKHVSIFHDSHKKKGIDSNNHFQPTLLSQEQTPERSTDSISRETGNSGIVEEMSKNQITAAIKIQKIFRGHLARRVFAIKRPLLHAHFERALPYIQDMAKLENLHKAANGASSVYFLPDAPVILKRTLKPPCERLEMMKKAREICANNLYFHLVIPKARTIPDFIIEECLPLGGETKKTEDKRYPKHR